ncbi:MAG: ABC transporter ATP-binding protein/permease [Acholeplasmatales bacterium]|nr:ABC transporter ATP-binding protein/permease [Acholeplasmatales bacterium]
MEDDFELEEETFTGHASKGTWKKIFKTVWKDKVGTIGMLVSVTIEALIDILYPLLNKYALENYFNELPNYDSLKWFIPLYVAICIAFGLSTYAFLRFVGRVQIHTAYELRKESFEQLQKLSFSYFDVTPSGWIMSRVTSDSRKLAEILSWGLHDFLWGALDVIGIIIVMFTAVNYKLALVSLAFLPLLTLIVIFVNKKILKSYRSSRKINSEVTGKFSEGFLGSKTTKSLVIEDKNKKDFNSLANKYRRTTLIAIAFSSMFGPIAFLITYIDVSAVMYAGLMFGLTGIEIYIGVDYTLKMFGPILSIAQILGDFKQAEASAERIISLINTEPEIKDNPQVIEKYGDIYNPKKENYEELIGSVKFNHVDFNYNTGEEVLSDFNLEVKNGQSIALVGHTGSGKSTIVNLICRFYEPTKGEILIDDINYKERSIGWLHSNIGYVLQSPQLFTGSILDNVRYGNLSATDEECIKALEIVDARDFIEALPDKYNTNVGEGGSRLSQGERQLISFARAIVANPKILILDEATSSIDTKSEQKIQNAISNVLKGRTSFIIAHRLSTIVNSDLILVMDKGQVVEKGTHSELLHKKGYYFELYKTQFKKAVEGINE